jgi:adenylate cyclase
MPGAADTGAAAGALPRERPRPGLLKKFRDAIALLPVGEPGSPERRAWTLFALLTPLANLSGAIDVFVFLQWVIPLPRVGSVAHVRLLNEIAFAIYLPLSFMCAGIWSNLRGRPIADWVNSGRPADEHVTRLVLRHPLRQLEINAAMWAGGVLIWGVLNGSYSLTLGLLVALTIALGGMSTCAVAYLLAERLLRPITALALAARTPVQPALPGVAARVLLAWGFSTAVPLLGSVLLGVLVLTGSSVSTTRLAVTGLFLAAAALGTGLIAMTVTAHSLSDPLKSVRAALSEVERGELDVEVAVDDGSEVGLLQAGFNRMVTGLREHEELRDLFGRHVGQEVAREALDRGVELGGEVREAAVMFVDVIGSTSLAAQRPPDDVVALLNRFFGLVVETVRDHGGWVNKFEGDGALCVFGAPVSVEDPSGCALGAARALDAALRAELPDLRAAIGVSAGPVVAGNVGASERFEYTVIGDPVNEAARLSELAKTTPGRVLASGSTLRAVEGSERHRWRRDGAELLRGRTEPTELAVPVSG